MSTPGSEDSQTAGTDRKATVQRLRKLEDSVVLLHRCFKSSSPLLGSLKVVEGADETWSTSSTTGGAQPDAAHGEKVASFHACLADLEEKLCCRMGALEAKVLGRCLALEESLGAGRAEGGRGRAATCEVANYAGRVDSLEERLGQVEAAVLDSDASSGWRSHSEETVVLDRISEWVEKLDSDVREAVTRLTEWVTKLDSDVNGLQRPCSQAQQGAKEISRLAERMAELNETVVGLQQSCKGGCSMEDDPLIAQLLERVAGLDDRVSCIPKGTIGTDAVLQLTEQLSRLEAEVTSYRVLCEGGSIARQDANMALRQEVRQLQEAREMVQQHLDVLQLQVDTLQLQFEKEMSKVAALADGLQEVVEDKSCMQQLDQVWDGLNAERQEREASLKTLSESLEGGLKRLVRKVDGTCAELIRSEAYDVMSASLTSSQSVQAYDVMNASLTSSRSVPALHGSPAMVTRASSLVVGAASAFEPAFDTATVLTLTDGPSEAAGSAARAASAPPRRFSCPGGAASPAPPPRGAAKTPHAPMPVLLGGAQAQHARSPGDVAAKDKHLCAECAAAPRSPPLPSRPLAARPPCGASGRSLARTDSNPAQFTPKLAAVAEGQAARGPVRWSTPSSPAVSCRKIPSSPAVSSRKPVVPGTYSPGLASRSPVTTVIPPA